MSNLGDTSLRKVLSFHSTCDPKSIARGSLLPPDLYTSATARRVNIPAPLPAELHCDECIKTFNTRNALANHKRQTHGYVDHGVSFIKEPKCPACCKEFSVLQTARNHFRKRVCVESRTFAIPAPKRSALAPRSLLEYFGRPTA